MSWGTASLAGFLTVTPITEWCVSECVAVLRMSVSSLPRFRLAMVPAPTEVSRIPPWLYAETVM